jgi:hypothetical protein
MVLVYSKRFVAHSLTHSLLLLMMIILIMFERHTRRLLLVRLFFCSLLLVFIFASCLVSFSFIFCLQVFSYSYKNENFEGILSCHEVWDIFNENSKNQQQQFKKNKNSEKWTKIHEFPGYQQVFNQVILKLFTKIPVKIISFSWCF